jgi:hypothetical protein
MEVVSEIKREVEKGKEKLIRTKREKREKRANESEN